MQELDIITQFVRRVRRHLLQRRALEATVYWGLAAVAWLLAVLVLGSLIPAGWGSSLLLWCTLLATIGFIGWRALGRSVLSSRNDRALAREIELAEPTFRNDLVTALQYGPDPSAHGSSPALVRAHMKQTARRTERFRHQTERLFRPKPLQTPLRVIGSLAAVALIVAATFPEALDRTGQLLLGHEPSVEATSAEAASADERRKTLLVGNLHLQLRYPSYTGIRSRTLRNTSGHIEVLAGTEIQFEGMLKEDATDASVILQNDEGTETELSAEVRAGRVVGSFSALESGTWRFRLTETDGEVYDNDIERQISVLPDTAPSVEIAEPTGMIDVTAREQVRFKMSAADDFGLSEINLVHGIELLDDDSARLPVAQVQRQATWAGEATLDLSTLELKPGDVVVVKAEALDNDEVARPKPGYSREVRLRVASPEDRHEAILEQEQELVDEMVLLLADYLDSPVLADEPGQAADDGTPDTPADDDLHEIRVSAQEIQQKRRKVLEQMRSIAQQMESDPLMLKRDYDLFMHLHRTLKDLDVSAKRALEKIASQDRAGYLTDRDIVRYGTRHRIPQVAETEKTIIRLEELIAAQWLDAAQMTVNAIHETIAELKQKLEEYKATGDPQLKQEIKQEIARLQRQLQDLTERLKRQTAHVPPEHMNRDAFKKDGDQQEQASASPADLMQRASDLQQMLDDGDIDGMLEALDEMDGSLEEMLGMSDAATRGSGGNGTSPMDQAANELMDAVNDLAQAEGALKRDTADLQDDLRKRTTQKLRDQLDSFMEGLDSQMDEIKSDLDTLQDIPLNDQDRAALSEVERAMNSADPLMELKDIEGLRPVLDRLARRAGDARRRMMSSRLGLPRDDPRHKDYQQAEARASDMQQTADDMVQKIDDLLQQAKIQPSADDLDSMKQLAEQQQKVREASDDLAQKMQQAGQMFPSLVEELEPQLGQAQNFMDDAQNNLQQGRLIPGLEDEQQALRTLHAMKRQLQQTVEKSRMGQSQAQSQPVKIPEPDRKAPKAFREDILDAMKEQGLDGYEDENSLYYKSLIE